MKQKFIVLTALLIFSKIVFAQELNTECATPENNNPPPSGVFSNSVDPSIYEDGEPIVLNLKYWKVNDPNGDFYVDFDESMILESVAHLNITFNRFNIFFKYRGWEELTSPADLVDNRWEDGVCVEYPDPDPAGFTNLNRCQIYGTQGLFGFAASNGYRDINAMNVYVTSHNNGFAGAAKNVGSIQLVVTTTFLSNTIMSHEMGHALGLYHTNSTSEHVTRDISDSNYNANFAGDRVVDTAATPGYYIYGCGSSNPDCYPYIIAEDCTYDQASPELDNSTPQRLYSDEIKHEDVINAMGNAAICREDYFSPGQGIKMRETIPFINIVAGTVTDIASLYEPYKGSYPAYYPYPEPWELPVFQPGFNYFFVECDGEYPQPAPYDEFFNYDINNILFNVTSGDTNYSNIIHPNHTAIYLKPENLPATATAFTQAQKCYNNYNTPPVIGGVVVKFNDNVFNNNVTVSPQDSSSINNTELINDLDPGLYNIIKNYENGESQENVIYKENN